MKTRVTVTFSREIDDRCDGDMSYLEQSYSDVTDSAYRQRYLKEDAERLAAFRRGDWHFIGVRAKAIVWIQRNNYRTNYTLESAGLYGIESDSSEKYLQSVFKEECNQLLTDIRAFGSVKVRS